MWGWRSSRTVVIATAGLAGVLFCVLPVLYMAVAALPAFSAAILLEARQRALMYNTVLLGAGTAVLATVVGSPLGFVLARVPFRFKTILRLALVAPALLPPYVIALSWIYMRAPNDAFSATLTRVLPDPYSLPGAIVVLTVALYPLSMLATEVSVRRLEPRLEEAALMVSRPTRTLTHITAPLIAPGVIAAALVVFVLAISEFSVPGLLRVRVFSTEVFTAFAALYDFSRATALAGPLLIVSLGVAPIAALLGTGRIVTTRRGATGASPIEFATWRGRALVAILLVAMLALVLPLMSLAREALRTTSVVEAIARSSDAAVNSIILAALGATAVTTLALPLGYARARTSRWIALLLDVTFVVLFTVPSTVLGIGLIGLWNRPGVAGAFYGTSVMLVVGHLARFLPIAALALSAVVSTIPRSHEEAAAIAGARWLRAMRGIVMPQIGLGLGAVWAIVFILAFGEVGTSILVAPAGESTLPIRVYTLTANAPPGYTAALALFQAAT
jgi:iron(III) transport system permease protein